MSGIMNAGGALSWVVLVVGLGGVLATVALAGLSYTKRRVPLALWACLPLLCVAVGAIGAWMGAGDIYGSLGDLEAGSVPGSAMAGVWNSLSIDWFSRWVAAFMFAAAAWGASVGALAAGDDTQFTPYSGAFAALTAIIGGVAIMAYGIQAGVGQQSTIMGVLIIFSGLGVSLGSFRRALDEQAERVAGMRFAASMCMFMGVSFGAGALFMGSRMDVLGVGGALEQADDLLSAIAMWGELAAPVITLGWAAIVVGGVIAFFGFYNELGQVVERFTLVDVFATMVLMGGLGMLRMVEHSRTDGLFAIGANGPVAALFAEYGSDLGAALLSIEKDTRPVDPGAGGFGDVFSYKNEAWTRTHKWNGTGWDEDETPLDSVEHGTIRPLLAIGSGEEARWVVDVLKAVPEGKALLMLRAFEVKEDVEVPDELSHLQVTFLELELGSEADFETEIWGDTGKRHVNWGPVKWFGETDGEEALVYLPGVFEDTQSTGLNIFVEERSRVKGMISSCLPVVMQLEEDGEVVPSDKWCRVHEGTEEEARLLAMETWEIPETEFTSMTVVHREGDQLDPELVIDRLMREVAAIEYCVNELLEEGEEELEGKMKLEVFVNKRGKVGDIKVHEKSKMQTPGAARCFAKRIKNASWEWPEDWEEPELEEGEEAPPLPTFDVLLELKAPPE
jgi:hypothetical protein